MESPLVTVVCLCYNHAKFVAEALASVFEQTYHPIELIVVDDASSDGSAEIIRRELAGRPESRFIEHRVNTGNCKAFNEAYFLSKGRYLIDLAADDALEPGRVAEGVSAFLMRPEAGVHYCDAYLMHEDGTVFGRHFKNNKKPPQGFIYRELLESYVICPPTLMYSRVALDALNGYDETLAYEDFDFLVRSSHRFQYIYSDQPLVRRRIVKGSMSSGQYARGSKAPVSTCRICEKAFSLNQTPEENKALRKRIYYELRQCIFSGNREAARAFLKLLKKMSLGRREG